MRPRRALIAGLAGALAAGLAACVHDGLGDRVAEHPAAVRLAVTVAVGKFVEADATDPAGRAQRVAEVATRMQGAVADGATATIAALEAEARDRIPWDQLTSTDRLLLDALLATLSAELARRTDQGLLSDQSRVRVAAVLGWVADAARLHAPP